MQGGFLSLPQDNTPLLALYEQDCMFLLRAISRLYATADERIQANAQACILKIGHITILGYLLVIDNGRRIASQFPAGSSLSCLVSFPGSRALIVDKLEASILKGIN